MGIYVFNAKAMFDALKGNTTDFGKEVIPSLVGKKNLRCMFMMITGKILVALGLFLRQTFNFVMNCLSLIFMSRLIRFIITRIFYLPVNSSRQHFAQRVSQVVARLVLQISGAVCWVSGQLSRTDVQ